MAVDFLHPYRAPDDEGINPLRIAQPIAPPVLDEKGVTRENLVDHLWFAAGQFDREVDDLRRQAWDHPAKHAYMNALLLLGDSLRTFADFANPLTLTNTRLKLLDTIVAIRRYQKPMKDALDAER
jgi:hypothetical protein